LMGNRLQLGESFLNSTFFFTPLGDLLHRTRNQYDAHFDSQFGKDVCLLRLFSFRQ